MCRRSCDEITCPITSLAFDTIRTEFIRRGHLDMSRNILPRSCTYNAGIIDQHIQTGLSLEEFLSRLFCRLHAEEIKLYVFKLGTRQGLLYSLNSFLSARFCSTQEADRSTVITLYSLCYLLDLGAMTRQFFDGFKTQACIRSSNDGDTS